MADILQRYADRTLGVLSCYDRVIIHGRIPEIAYAKGMEMYLRTHGVRQFDFPKFAQPLRDEIRGNAETLAAEHGIEVQFIRHHEQRKEAIVAKILEQRGDAPGLVAILSALEVCPTFEPWHD